MKRTLILLLLFLGSCRGYNSERNYRFEEGFSYAPGTIGAEDIFSLTDVAEIKISISLEEWNELLQNIDENYYNEDYVSAETFSFTLSGQTTVLTNVGFRVRGNPWSSRNRPEYNWGEEHCSESPCFDFAHFRVNFDKFVDGQSLSGLDSLILKWPKDDTTFVREVFSYEMFHRFGVVTAPRASFVHLVIDIIEDENPVDYGVYTMIEPIDKTFVKSRYPESSDGFLWKCLYPADLISSRAEIGIEDPNIGYMPAYDLKMNKSLFDDAEEELLNFMEKSEDLEGEEFAAWIEEALDVDNFIRTYAVNVAVGMWDDYWGNANNFYLYFDEEGMAHFIPYDYDNTLGIGWDPADISAFHWGALNDDRPLMQKLFRIEEYRNLYAECLAVLIDEENFYITPDAAMERVGYWQNLIKPYITNDLGRCNEFIDEAADWGDLGYRLMSGSANHKPYNFFMRRVASIQEDLETLEAEGWEGIYDEEFLNPE